MYIYAIYITAIMYTHMLYIKFKEMIAYGDIDMMMITIMMTMMNMMQLLQQHQIMMMMTMMMMMVMMIMISL